MAVAARAPLRVSATVWNGALVEGNADSGLNGWPGVVMSSTGRYVVFYSDASSLWPIGPDGNMKTDVFVADRTTGQIDLVSLANNGSQGNGRSDQGVITPDGNLIAFQSRSDDLLGVNADQNDAADIFLRNRAAPTTTLVSVTYLGVQANDDSSDPSISGDGQRVAFISLATNLVAGDGNGVADVFVRDLSGTPSTTRVSVSSAPANTPADQPSYSANISRNGQFVTFSSSATTLTSLDVHGHSQIYVRDLANGVTELVSVSASGGDAGNLDSIFPNISADGRYVIFYSQASNLVGGDGNNKWDCFVFDRANGTMKKVSESSAGAAANGDAWGSYPSISDDGVYAAFGSYASNLASNDNNLGDCDAFVKNTSTGAIEMMSQNVAGAPGNADSCNSTSIDAVGVGVAFPTTSSNLVGKTNAPNSDVYVSLPAGPALTHSELDAFYEWNTTTIPNWAGVFGPFVPPNNPAYVGVRVLPVHNGNVTLAGTIHLAGTTTISLTPVTVAGVVSTTAEPVLVLSATNWSDVETARTGGAVPTIELTVTAPDDAGTNQSSSFTALLGPR